VDAHDRDAAIGSGVGRVVEADNADLSFQISSPRCRRDVSDTA